MTTVHHCYSLDGEVFHGKFSEPHDAVLAAAERAGGRRCGNIYVATVTEPREILDRGQFRRRLGELVEEAISDQLGEEVGEAVEGFAMKAEQCAALGESILDWLDANVEYKCFGVGDVNEVRMPVPGACDTEGGSLD